MTPLQVPDEATTKNATSSTDEKKKKVVVESVLKFQLDPKAEFDDKGFLEAWKEAFPCGNDIVTKDVRGSSNHPLFDYNAAEDPETAIGVIHDAFQFCVQWLPREVLHRVMNFPYDPKGPSCILIQGLPVCSHGGNGASDDSDNFYVPPTPIKNAIHLTSLDSEGDKQWARTSTFAPLAETWLLGIGRMMGTLQSPPWNTNGKRGGLVNDMIPVCRGNFPEMADLRMHRDFPRQVAVGPPETQIFILLAARGDPDHLAKTIIMDSAKLVELMDPADLKLLQTYKIQCQKQTSPDSDPFDYGTPFHVVDPIQPDLVTLLVYPNQIMTAVVPTDESDENNNNKQEIIDSVLEAYQRVEELAWQYGEAIDLQQGDMLIINNCRLVHGRSAYKPKMDGTDRWLVKCYVNNQLWQQPSTGHGSGSNLTTFPNLS